MEGGKDFGDTDEGADQVDIGGDGGLNESNTPFEPPFKFPPGYRFCPTDDELINHYLIQKILNRPLPYNNINEVNLYDYNPQHLTESFKSSGENEWYFFTPRDKKYRNGSRPNRAAGDGYWKATGADKPVYTNGIVEPIGVRKALVFYKGKPPKGDKTNWIMHEYRLNESTDDRKKYSNSMRLDDWVLCRVYEKPNNDKSTKGPRDEHSDTVNSTRSIEELPYASKINTSDIFEMSMLPTLTTDPMGLNFPNDYSLPTYSSWFSSGYPSHPSDSNLSDLSTSDIFNSHLDNVEFGQVDQYLSVEPNASDTTTHAMMMNKYRPMPRSMNMEEELSTAPQVDMYSRNIMGQYDASGYQDEVKGLNQRKEKQKISTAKHQGVILKRHYTS